MVLTARCWFCSEEIPSTERAKVVAELNVLVHVKCFDRLYEREGVRSWSAKPRPADAPKSRHDDDEEAKAS